MYHKVDIIVPTMWWVTPAMLRRQIDELSDRQFVYLDDYDTPATQAVITIDDAYENVVRHALPMLRHAGTPFEVFVVGDAIGSWDRFGGEEPLTRLMDYDGLDEVIASGGRVQWHTRTHRNLTRLDDGTLDAELSIPQALTDRYPAPHLRWLAYPGGSHDARVVAATRPRFAGAVSVITGDPADRWQWNRVTVEESTSFVMPFLSLMRHAAGASS